MIWYRFFEPETEYKKFGTKKRYVDKIFSFDIETTSFYIDREQVRTQSEYDPQAENKDLNYFGCMYIWMLGIDDCVYYGRTWEQLRDFLERIDSAYPEKKIFFVHNLSFEFQFLRSVFEIDKVFARSQRKPIYCTLADFNIEFRCTYFMTNNALKDLPKFYGLPIEKLVGELDYSKIRTPITPIEGREWAYCENDILIIYHYIRYMLTLYPNINRIPKTNTGQIREELQEITRKDWSYRNQVRRAINTDPHVYNLLLEAFQGGYVHANWHAAGLILENIDSVDIASSYPGSMCINPYPGTEFKRCYIKRPDEMIPQFAYLVKVKFTGLKSRLQNTIISYSHCRNIIDGAYDNGRVMEAEELEIVCTDIDLKIYLQCYNYDKVEILESYYSIYKYLPEGYVRFILDKYQKKTSWKNIPEKALEYGKEKNRFNAIFGMAVTNTIRNEVEYSGDWSERELTNEEIEQKLWADKKKGFLSFSYGVWVTAWSRKALLDNLIKLDPYVIYADTDSLKLLPGYDKNVIKDYNKSVIEKSREICKKREFKYSEFTPKDIKGKSHMMGIYEFEGTYDKFKTLGAKKYCVEEDGELKITVAGVPKKGAACLKSIAEFKKGKIFSHEVTGKNALFYNDNQELVTLTDYTGREYTITDRTGCCILPADYTLGVTEEYEELFGSARAKYKE